MIIYVYVLMGGWVGLTLTMLSAPVLLNGWCLATLPGQS